MLLISMVVLISRRPEGSGRAERHAHLARSSIEPTTILLRKQKYRLDWNKSINVQSHSGCTRTQSLAGANKRHQVVVGGCEVIVEKRGLN
jgi:hypothetical protein